MADHAADECLFRREVVVQGGDVDARVGGHVARAQTLEALAGDALVSGGDQRLATIGGRLRHRHLPARWYPRAFLSRRRRLAWCSGPSGRLTAWHRSIT